MLSYFVFIIIVACLGPAKNLTRDDVLGEILDGDQDTEDELASKLGASPPRRISISIRLTPLPMTVTSKSSPLEDNLSIQPLQSPSKPTACEDASSRSVLLSGACVF